MSTEEKANEESTDFVLDDTLSIAGIGAMASNLRAVVNENKNVVLDASNVNSIDAASLQLLAAFASKIRSQNGAISLQSPSEVFQKNAELLGLFDCFQKAA